MFAYRHKGDMNWEVKSERQHLDRVRAKYAELYPEGLEIRAISEGLLKETEDAIGWSRFDAFEKGWRFDSKKNLWRPPEEPLPEPEGEPLPFSEFKVISSLSFNVPSGPIELEGGFTYNPFDRVIRQLEQIISGVPSRAFIDVEGKYLEFISYPKENGKVRFILNYYTSSGEKWRETLADILIDRRIIVEQFYDYIINKFCEKNEIHKFRSSLLEDYLN